MGCDIHFVVEKKYDDRWIGVFSSSATPRFMSEGEWNLRAINKMSVTESKKDADESTPVMLKSPFYFYRHPVFDGRNYEFFASLAGVRGEGPEPKGVPDDVSELAQIEINGWDSDGHSHSYDTLRDFVRKWLLSMTPDEDDDEANPQWIQTITSMLNGTEAELISAIAHYYDDEQHEFRVVYWFDN
jgi:hypothetical protein